AAAAELVHLDGHPVQLDAARVLDDRDADRVRRGRRGGGESSEPEDRNEDRTDGPHRRPRIHRIKVRTTLSRSDVASGKENGQLPRWLRMSPGSRPSPGAR